MLQFKNELNNTSARLAEEVENSANTEEQYNMAVDQAQDMAQALALAVSACQKQKVARQLVNQKLDAQAQKTAKALKDREVAYAQVWVAGCL